MTEGNSTKRDICPFDYSIRVMNNHAGSTFDSAYRETVFTYKRSLKLSQGEGCLGCPRTYNEGLGKITMDFLRI